MGYARSVEGIGHIEGCFVDSFTTHPLQLTTAVRARGWWSPVGGIVERRHNLRVTGIGLG